MWHEARKQEKKIRGMMVDYRKRAERRRDFYEKFKADPTQFLQLHGRPCKIHLDPAVALAGDGISIMMPWQGHPDVLIDRFDVRAHLDSIVEVSSGKNEDVLTYEERTMNYERYRILVQNEFLGVNEEKFLHQICLEEQFGPIALKQSDMLEKEKRKKGAAIGFNYEDSTSSCVIGGFTDKKSKDEVLEKNGSDTDDSDLDFDLCLDLSQIDTPSAHEMNAVGQRFGLTGNDFFSFLTNDVEEQEAMRLARQQEEEKAMFSGRKARRERQAFREKKLIGRVMSPPSYAARKSPTYDKYSRCNKSQSRSTSPENTGKITYITSFGGEDSNDEKRDDKSSVCKSVRKTKKREHDSKSRRTSSYKSRRSKSAGSRSRSLSPKRRRKYSRSRSLETRSLASNLKKLISRKKERRSRSGSSDRFRNYSKWRSRSRSRSRRRSWSSRSRSGSSRSGRGRSKSSRSASSYIKKNRWESNSSGTRSRSRSSSENRPKNLYESRSSSSASASVSPESPKREQSPAKVVVPRYYGRNRKDSSSSLSLESSDSDSKVVSGQPCSSSGFNKSTNKRGAVDDQGSSGRSAGNARPTSKQSMKERPQEKLKKKMQALLNKQFRADKKAERERLEKAEQERQDREAELRDIAIKIRRRERYLRHRGEDEENDGEKEAMRRRERYLKRLAGEEDDEEAGDKGREDRESGRRRSRSRREGSGSGASGGGRSRDGSRDGSPDAGGRRSRSRGRRSRSQSPKLGKRTLVDY